MIWFVLVAVLLRLSTLAVSIQNEKRLKANGAIEFGTTNSTVLALAHILFCTSAAAEGLWRSDPVDVISYFGLCLYGFGMIMLLVVIGLLGRWWTVKLIVARDHELVTHPMFRWVRHPNYYLNILPELTGLALALHSFGTLLIGLPCYILILAMRIRLEESVMKDRFGEY
jgi:isoprenylcysteine carboxyl methyltransferase (ICMT) family protein YpbQ